MNHPAAAQQSARALADLPRHYLKASMLFLIGTGPTGAGPQHGNSKYGYDLRAQLAGLGIRLADWSQIYRGLRGLEREGLVISCWETSEVGPARRTYHVTDKGARQLHEWIEAMDAGRRLVGDLAARHRVRASQTRHPAGQSRHPAGQSRPGFSYL